MRLGELHRWGRSLLVALEPPQANAGQFHSITVAGVLDVWLVTRCTAYPSLTEEVSLWVRHRLMMDPFKSRINACEINVSFEVGAHRPCCPLVNTSFLPLLPFTSTSKAMKYLF